MVITVMVITVMVITVTSLGEVTCMQLVKRTHCTYCNRTYCRVYSGSSSPDALGPERTIVIIEVSSFQGLKVYFGLL